MNGPFRALSKQLIRINRATSPAKVITLVFAVIIVLGASLLAMPFASRTGQSCGFLTALFTSCSATCVTGLSLVDTYSQWSAFGQLVLLVLIQVGGLGFMTVFSLFLLAIRAKLGLKKRMILQQTYGLTDIHGVVELLRRVICGTVIIELIGAVVLSLRFARDFPLKNAIWMGIFHSVSAFCNAGFDLMGRLSPGSSLAYYARDAVVCITVMLLITLGGIGFFVWMDLWNSFRGRKGVSVYTRLVLCISAILVFGGALAFGAAEWNNPETLGAFDTGGKLLGAMFQSVTTRTAGFAAIPQAKMTELSKVLSCIWMLIGGSSGSTAGGMKTVTVGVLLLSTLSNVRGKSRLTVFHRTVAPSQISIASTIVTLMVSLSLLGAVVLMVVNGIPFVDALFETTSALGTVGLTADVTATLNVASQIMIIVFMFFGRVGIMTIAMGFLLSDRSEERIRYADTKLMLG